MVVLPLWWVGEVISVDRIDTELFRSPSLACAS